MRVISGTARGRRLSGTFGETLRPTTDKVKESMFNIIQFELEGRKVLDLFAGTGQLGIEALSRGASRCVFVDQDRSQIELIRKNLNLTGFSGRSRVVRDDAVKFLRSCREKFDLLFLDPPYGTDVLDQTLEEVTQIDILMGHGIIVCETAVKQILPQLSPPYQTGREYHYGKIKLTICHRQGERI